MDSSITLVLILLDDTMKDIRGGFCMQVGMNPGRTSSDG